MNLSSYSLILLSINFIIRNYVYSSLCLTVVLFRKGFGYSEASFSLLTSVIKPVSLKIHRVMSQDQEQQVKTLKRILEGWRMALLPLKSVFLWEQQWHPCAIVAAITLIYLCLWLLDLNFLATFAIVGLFLNFIDFLVPIICNSIYSPNSWTGQKEKMFEDICRSLVCHYNKMLQDIHSFFSLRETSPCLYYIISISMSCILAWMSSSINNIFLLYIFSIVMLLWPGVQHRGIFNTLLSMINMAPKAPSFKSE